MNINQVILWDECIMTDPWAVKMIVDAQPSTQLNSMWGDKIVNPSTKIKSAASMFFIKKVPAVG